LRNSTRHRATVDRAGAVAAGAFVAGAFYTIRSERQLMEQLHYNLLYRWFIGLGVDDPVWVPTVFTKNRNAMQGPRLLVELIN